MRKIIELTAKIGLSCALAAILLLPSSIEAQGADGGGQQKASLATLPLPPIEHLETIAWFVLKPQPSAFKIDTLLAPKFELLGPAIAGGELTSTNTLPLLNKSNAFRNG